MTARDGLDYINQQANNRSGLTGRGSRSAGLDYGSTVETTATVTYKMIGRASGIWVSWISTGSPDFAGDEYTGPGTLDLSTISVSS